MPDIHRRTLIAAAAGSLLARVPAATAQTASRSYRILRGGSDIGSHRISVTRQGEELRSEVAIAIAVKVLGFTAYRYDLQYTETYRGGLLQAFDATCNDDGETDYAKAIREGDTLRVYGSKYSGQVPGQSVPTSYWRQASLGTTPWISAQSGEILDVSSTEVAPPPEAPAGARCWRVTDRGEYDLTIWYDAAGDWQGCSFDARGEKAVYRLEPGSASFAGMIG